ncbi:glycosyltransferase family 4 protein [Deinococcus arenicola]|uniref:Glycosyltransferase family 4 protein n=1 Tax=Deinococcus arenicola TaxID=2994950 RepID=A0ABU4DU14_9DEIO|nr:glycosyltransferase family 4 protein [Deinococcus sp. ZS9-10]MDV6375395.1 glycosyltransferase family 4 protein [Deinococcus sp. ZS9-10]
MHVLVVTQYFWPENFRINDMVAGLHERGHQVTVLTGHPNYPGGSFTHGYRGKRVIQEQYEGIRVIRVPMLVRGQGSGLKLALNYLSFAVSGSLLGPGLVGSNFDAIFVYEPSPMTVGFPAMAIKLRTGRPILFYIQDLWPESLVATGFVTHPVLLRAVELMVRGIYRACDQILVTSRAFIPKVQRLGVPLERIHYYPQYAESFYRPQAPDLDWARARGLPDGFKIMFAGNMGTAQDLFTVLDAAEQTREQGIQWVFLGNGSVREEMEQRAASRDLSNVHFLGSHPAGEMPAYFAQADALLVSLTADDLFALTVPAKLQSYLACGRPILAALEGEGAQIVHEAGAGIAVKPGKSEVLANAAIQLQQLNHTTREELGQRGRRYFETHFERESMLTELENMLEKAGQR